MITIVGDTMEARLMIEGVQLTFLLYMQFYTQCPDLNL